MPDTPDTVDHECQFVNGECVRCDADCPTCNGIAWRDGDDGDVLPCKACNPDEETT
jgi:hypothetical protein